MWAPLRGFMYGPRSLICARATTRNRTSGERRCCLTRARSPGAEGGEAPALAQGLLQESWERARLCCEQPGA